MFLVPSCIHYVGDHPSATCEQSGFRRKAPPLSHFLQALLLKPLAHDLPDLKRNIPARQALAMTYMTSLRVFQESVAIGPEAADLWAGAASDEFRELIMLKEFPS